MAEFQGNDFSISDLNDLVIEQEVAPILDEEVPGLVSTLLQNMEVELDDDTILRIDGLDADGLYSVMLAASTSLKLMQDQRQSDADDAEDENDLYNLAVKLRVASTHQNEWSVRQEFESDPEALETALNVARVSRDLVRQYDEDRGTVVEREFAEDVLTWDDRWNPERSKVWTANEGRGKFVFKNGGWYHFDNHVQTVYQYPHFGYLDKSFFPMVKG